MSNRNVKSAALVVAAASLLFVPAATAPSARGQSGSTLRGLPAVSLDRTGLDDALTFLQNLSGLTFYVDWPRLELAGIDRSAPVTLQLRNVSVRKTLSLILDSVSPDEPLTFYVDNGVVTITTLEHADSELIVKVYDVRDLLVDVPNFRAPTNLGGGGGNGGGFGGGGSGGGSGGSGGFGSGGGSGGSGGFGSGGGGGGGTGGGGGNGDTTDGKSKQERADDLVSLITTTIRTEVWQVNGGRATIAFFNGNLVVNAPRSVHDLL